MAIKRSHYEHTACPQCKARLTFWHDLPENDAVALVCQGAKGERHGWRETKGERRVLERWPEFDNFGQP